MNHNTRKLAREPVLTPSASQHGTSPTATTNSTTNTSTSPFDVLVHAATQDDQYHNIEADDDDNDAGDGGDIDVNEYGRIDGANSNIPTNTNMFWSALVGMGGGGGGCGGGGGGSSLSPSSAGLGAPVNHRVSTPVPNSDTPALLPTSATFALPSKGNNSMLLAGGSPCVRTGPSSTTSPTPSTSTTDSVDVDGSGEGTDGTMSYTMSPNTIISKREVKFKLGTMRASASSSHI